jgi:hypothetical protein
LPRAFAAAPPELKKNTVPTSLGTYGLGEYSVVLEGGPPKPIAPPGSPPAGTFSMNGDG